jgi:hypothetical protein
MITRPFKGTIDPRSIKVPKPAVVESVSATHTSPASMHSGDPSKATPVAPDDLTPATAPYVPDASGSSSQTSLSLLDGTLSFTGTDGRISYLSHLVKDECNDAFFVVRGHGNPYLVKVKSEFVRSAIKAKARLSGKRLNNKKLVEILDDLQDEALSNGPLVKVWRRIAALKDGSVVIDLADENRTQVHISAGEVKIVQSGSEVMFYRPPSMLPLSIPAQEGDCQRLKHYVNLDPQAFTLLLAWLTYTIAHAKVPGNVFVILTLIGGQGTGKSWTSKTLLRLLDPSVVGVERMPSNVKDIAIGSKNHHVLAYDNQRYISNEVSDLLCVLVTGGSLSSRRLYTDDEQHVLHLHAALILNGIYDFVTQPDLMQRALLMRLEPLPECERRSEAEMQASFEADLPVILRGLYDLIAKIQAHLPVARVVHPQRMYQFVKWLAAWEVAEGVPHPVYQEAYAEAINEGQLDALRDNVLGGAMLDFANTLQDRHWSGTPAALLGALEGSLNLGYQRPPKGWPENEIALSKRLAPLQSALQTQGVEVEFKRGKQRLITINVTEK